MRILCHEEENMYTNSFCSFIYNHLPIYKLCYDIHRAVVKTKQLVFILLNIQC